MVSIGTGDQHERFASDRALAWSLVDWATKSVGMAIDGAQHEVDQHLDRVLCGPEDTYHRLQRSLDRASVGPLDDASEENLDALEALAEAFLAGHRDEIQGIASRLSELVKDRASADRRSARGQDGLPLAQS